MREVEDAGPDGSVGSADTPGPLTHQAEPARIVSVVAAKHAVEEQPDALADRQRLVHRSGRKACCLLAC